MKVTFSLNLINEHLQLLSKSVIAKLFNTKESRLFILFYAHFCFERLDQNRLSMPKVRVDNVSL